MDIYLYRKVRKKQKEVCQDICSSSGMSGTDFRN